MQSAERYGSGRHRIRTGHDRKYWQFVKIDPSTENAPDQTIRKMQQVTRTAPTPAEPSGTERAVAAQAGQVETQARQEKVKQENAERTEDQNAMQNAGSLPAATARRPYQNEMTGQALNIMA